MTEEISFLKEDSKSLQSIYAALGHAIRYDIVKYLGAFHRPIHYTELVEWLQIKPGSFYFHIRKLKDLVKQDEEKRFYLSTTGELALNLIQSGENMRTASVNSQITGSYSEKGIPKRFSTIFLGEFIRIIAFNTRIEILASFTLIIQFILLESSKLGIIPFFLDGNLYFNMVMCFIELICSVFLIWILLELITRYFTPIKGFSRELLVGIPLAISPLFIYPILIIMSEKIEFLSNFLSNEAISLGIIVVLQLSSAIFLIQLLQVIKSVNFERALVPVFMILYGFSILSFLLSSLAIL